MPRRVLLFLSEILSSQTLLPVLAALRARGCDVRVINDGFCRAFLDSEGCDYELIDYDFAGRIAEPVAWADVVVTGKSYVEPSEYLLMELARAMGKPLLLALPDPGADVVMAKLRSRDGVGHITLPVSLVADARTRSELVRRGLPADRLIPAGNPYFDDLYDRLASPLPDVRRPGTVAYFATPFDLDWERGILPTDYSHRRMIEDVKERVESLGAVLIAKNHPQVPKELLEGIEIFDGHPLDLIRRVTATVSSYSTTLLEAWVAGVPSVSYQPWTADIRADVFAERIPIVKNLADLERALGEALTAGVASGAPRPITFFPGQAREAYVAAIEQLGDQVISFSLE
jgi:hypothetical protein